MPPAAWRGRHMTNIAGCGAGPTDNTDERAKVGAGLYPRCALTFPWGEG